MLRYVLLRLGSMQIGKCLATVKETLQIKNNSQRESFFISHASPEDNDFVLSPGTRLTALGYEVWADILKLRGGQNWTKKLEDALQNKAPKMLLVCTYHG